MDFLVFTYSVSLKAVCSYLVLFGLKLTLGNESVRNMKDRGEWWWGW